MGAAEASIYVFAIGLALFFLRPLAGMLMDAFKVVIRICFVMLLLLWLPLDFIDNWSKTGVDKVGLGPTLVPIFGMMAIVAMNTVNLTFLNGTKVEQVAKLGAYIIAGVFAAGNPAWIDLTKAVGLFIVAGLQVAAKFLQLILTTLKDIRDNLPGQAPTPTPAPVPTP